MAIHKKTGLNILLIAFVLSFFVTPLGHFGKVFLNRLFSASPDPIEEGSRQQLLSYHWKLKDAQGNYFNFEKSEDRVVFINFWASWRLPSEAELKGIQELYNDYGAYVGFYIITNEERLPVEEFMEDKKYTFPVTYQIIGEPAPLEILEPPGSYIIDKNGYIVVKEDDIADWDTTEIRQLLDELISE
ncbi:MAG: TlpA family protein disulfide reductase [Maribacter sp.]|nr:TlpA family protein disulfide reductase [Maribacter sp.]